MAVSIWCTNAASLMLTAFCFTTPASAIGVVPGAELTHANTVMSGIVGGGYAASAMNNLIDEVPVLNLIPIEFFSLEDQVTNLLERESSRQFRNWVRDEIEGAGFTGSYSIGGGPGGSLAPYRASVAKKRTKLRARISSRRLGLSLLFRF